LEIRINTKNWEEN